MGVREKEGEISACERFTERGRKVCVCVCVREREREKKECMCMRDKEGECSDKMRE